VFRRGPVDAHGRACKLGNFEDDGDPCVEATDALRKFFRELSKTCAEFPGTGLRPACDDVTGNRAACDLAKDDWLTVV